MSITLTQSQIDEVTTYVNSYRAMNQAPPMAWNTTIAGVSQAWSTKLLTTNKFQHSGNPSYGENLAFFQGYGTDPVVLIKKSIDSWYNEIAAYDFSNPGFSEATGHFTCLVWVASTSFGMGIAINSTTGAAYITMNTSPAGNIIGEFPQNVLAKTGSQAPVNVSITTHNKAQAINSLNSCIVATQRNFPKQTILTALQNVVHLLQVSSDF